VKHLIIISLLFSFHVIADYSSAGEYTVGINDALDIKVLDHEELRTLTTVAADGSITFPYIGTVNVKNMTLSEIEEDITKRLSEGYIKYPVVSVSLVKSMSRKIFLYGEVNKRGEIPLDENMTLLRALSAAGGVYPSGLYGKVNVRRKHKDKPGYTDTEIDLKSILDGKGSDDILLQPDDVLIVMGNKIFVHGEVGRPGEFVLEKDMTVVKALSIAIGVTANGLYGKVKVRRKQEGEPGYKDIPIDLKGMTEGSETGDMPLQPDDEVIVERNKTFFVHGEVGRPGEFVLEKNMTVVKALSIASGVTANGLYGKVKVRRKQEGEPGYKDIPIDLKGMTEGSETGDMPLQPDDEVIVERNKTFFVYGEVNRPGQYVLEDNMTVFKAITVAGGFTRWGSPNRVKVLRQTEDNTGLVTIKVKLKDVIKGDAGADVLLKPGDTIVVSSGIF